MKVSVWGKGVRGIQWLPLKVKWKIWELFDTVLLPGKSHGWRSLVGYSPWCCKELDTTERLHFLSFHFPFPSSNPAYILLVEHFFWCVRIKHFEKPSLTPYVYVLSHFSHVWLCATPETAAHQAPLSLGFSRQEHWSGLPFPSPMHESEEWKGRRSVMSDS